jgi:ribonuclease VapC
MIIDASALLAIALQEAEGDTFLDLIERDPVRLISVASMLESAIVVESRLGLAAGEDLDELVTRMGLEMEPVTVDQLRIARVAYRRYGKGNHPAGLNFGDCFSYALAKAFGEPLLFKGDDFSRTDIAVCR